MSAGERAFELLLRLYPREFRSRYGRAMRDFHRDRLRVARESGESMLAVWLRTAVDMITSAAAEHARPFLSGDELMETLLQDVRFTLRGLGRRPLFTVIVVSTIGLGVGVNAAIFSVVSGVLLRPLPYPRPDELLSFGHEPPQWLTSSPDFIDYQREMRSLAALAAYTRGEATLTHGDAPSRIRFARGSDKFFDALGVHPLIGRTFTPEEHVPAIAPSVILSYHLWQTEFAGDRQILGTKILIAGTPRVVVGVMPERFAYPTARTDAWLPLARFNPDSAGDRTNNYLFMVGRLKPGTSLLQAQTEAKGIAHRIMQAEPEKFDPKSPLIPHLSSVTDDLVGKTRPYLFALLGAVGFVLLIACANVANLLLVRGETRRKEMALRSALGASRRRLAMQMLTESLVLSFAGAALGLLLAILADRALVAAAPSTVPRIDEIGLDWRVLSFTALVAIVTGLLVGVAPALRAAREDVAEALKDGGKTTVVAGRSHSRRVLVIAEMALAVTMLSGSGMLLRSLWHLENAGVGFEPRGVLTARIAISQREYNDERAAAFYQQLIERMRALPGVTAAGASGWLPVVDAGGLWGFRPERGNYPDGRWPSAVPQQVTPGYFNAIKIPIVAGRDFSTQDRFNGELVAIVSQRFAELAWPGQSAIGRRFGLDDKSPFMTVVGVVGDLRARGFGDTPEPTMYFPTTQAAKSAYYLPRAMALLIRTDGNPLALAAAVKKEVLALDRSAPVSEVRTLENVVGQSVSNRRFSTALLAGFAGLALLLAGIGTYGVISYGVTQRRFEIGLRMALGAESTKVLSLVMTEGIQLATLGLALGLLGSIGVARVLRAMLVGVGMIDPPSMVATGIALAFVAVIASWIPALRALRVNPIEALRSS